MYVYDSLSVVEKVKIYVEVSCKLLSYNKPLLENNNYSSLQILGGFQIVLKHWRFEYGEAIVLHDSWGKLVF
mgnify:CR=1 FL=1